jgi:coenzyme PQQ precursor peptide PqqA
MEQESIVPRPGELVWDTPAFEEIRVSAEATAYMGVQDDAD